MKSLCQNMDVKTTMIPGNIKVGKPNWVLAGGVFPRRLWFPTTWKRKVSVEVEEAKLKVEGASASAGWNLESVVKSAFGFGVSAALSFSLLCHASPSLAQSLTVAFPVSRAPEVLSLSLLSLPFSST